jgi:hypothetical protein
MAISPRKYCADSYIFNSNYFEQTSTTRNRWPNSKHVTVLQSVCVALLRLYVFAIHEHQMHKLGWQAVGLNDLVDARLRRDIKLNKIALAFVGWQIIAQRCEQLQTDFHTAL